MTLVQAPLFLGVMQARVGTRACWRCPAPWVYRARRGQHHRRGDHLSGGGTGRAFGALAFPFFCLC